jgi:CheY-like chemotaxis protein
MSSDTQTIETGGLAEHGRAPALPVLSGQNALVVHVVDDDEAVRRSLALLLSSYAMQAETHDSAETVLSRLDTLRPGCLIVDIRMPGMDGLELQAELSRRQCALPVIIVTGHADVGLAVRAMKAGAVDFIEKPYSEGDLLRAVRRGGAAKQGDCPRTRHQSAHGGDSSREFDGEAVLPQFGGSGAHGHRGGVSQCMKIRCRINKTLAIYITIPQSPYPAACGARTRTRHHFNDAAMTLRVNDTLGIFPEWNLFHTVS